MSPDRTDRLDRLGFDAVDGLRAARQGSIEIPAARLAMDRTMRRRRVVRAVVAVVVLAVLAVSAVRLRPEPTAPANPHPRPSPSPSVQLPLSGNGAIVLETGSGVVAAHADSGAVAPVSGLGMSHDPDTAYWLPVAFSPDGKRLLLLGGSRIGVFDVGSGQVALVRGADEGTDVIHPAMSMAWSPDGSQLATIAADGTVRVDTLAHGSGSGADLRVATTRTFATGVRGAVNTHMAWSPDGMRLAFVGLRADERYTPDLYVVSVDGTGLRRLHANAAGNVGEAHGPANVAWSPDGTQLAFLEYFGSELVQLQLIRPDGTGKRTVVAVPFPGGEPCDCNKFDPPPLTWAPDATAVAFQSEQVPGGNGYGAFVATLDGNVRLLTYQRSTYPGIAWRPIGR